MVRLTGLWALSGFRVTALFLGIFWLPVSAPLRLGRWTGVALLSPLSRRVLILGVLLLVGATGILKASELSKPTYVLAASKECRTDGPPSMLFQVQWNTNKKYTTNRSSTRSQSGPSSKRACQSRGWTVRE